MYLSRTNGAMRSKTKQHNNFINNLVIVFTFKTVFFSNGGFVLRRSSSSSVCLFCPEFCLQVLLRAGTNWGLRAELGPS